MILDLPFWFRQRQATATELAQGSYKVTGPNLQEAVVSIRIDDDLKWRGYLQAKTDGPNIDVTPACGTAKDAMGAAFELYRMHMIV